MKVLLDTNILIHREANRVVNKDIGVLFNWLDKLNYEKCISPLSLKEIEKHQNKKIVETIKTKIQSYNLLKTQAPDSENIQNIRNEFDTTDNDRIDTSLLNEVYKNRVSYLITEDRGIHKKARLLGIEHLVFSINDFLEKVITENPELSEYKVLSVEKKHFGEIDITDSFFDSFRKDYEGFDDWFNKKSEEKAFVSFNEKQVVAFLYLKIEKDNENYSDINPIFDKKKRLKIGTLKVISTGHKLGERFLRIAFVEALKNKVDEVYVTIFNNSSEQKSLIFLLKEWGFVKHGEKNTGEDVYVKNFQPIPDKNNPKLTYPFIDKNRQFFIVPIHPQYHTDLLPDSYLQNENPQAFKESKTHRNAIQKVYISGSLNRDIYAGDVIVFYRTGGRYKSVVTTICVVENKIEHIQDVNHLISLCKKRSIFSDKELAEYWNHKKFIVNFLYLYSLRKRLNMQKLIDLEIIASVNDAPRGFEKITKEQFELILKESEADESFIIN